MMDVCKTRPSCLRASLQEAHQTSQLYFTTLHPDTAQSRATTTLNQHNIMAAI